MALAAKRPRYIGFGPLPLAPPRITRVTQQPTTRGGSVRAAGGSAPRPVSAPKPVAPVQEAVPAVVAPPLITLPSSTADRATAREQFSGSLGEGNRGLSQLAQALGGLSSVGQYGYNAGTDPRDFGSITSSQLAINPNDPNSTMATIMRNLGKNMQFVGDTNENRNTYNSGIRLNEEAEQQTNANNARTKATQDYENARLNLVDQMTGNSGAWGALRGAIRGANAADDAATAAAAAQAEAQRQADAQAAAAAAAAAGPAGGAAPTPQQGIPYNATVFGHPMHFPALSPYEEWRRRNPLGVWGR